MLLCLVGVLLCLVGVVFLKGLLLLWGSSTKSLVNESSIFLVALGRLESGGAGWSEWQRGR